MPWAAMLLLAVAAVSGGLGSDVELLDSTGDQQDAIAYKLVGDGVSKDDVDTLPPKILKAMTRIVREEVMKATSDCKATSSRKAAPGRTSEDPTPNPVPSDEDDCPTELQQYDGNVKGPKTKVKMRVCDEESLEAFQKAGTMEAEFRSFMMYNKIDDARCGNSTDIRCIKNNRCMPSWTQQEQMQFMCPMWNKKAGRKCIPDLQSWKAKSGNDVLNEAKMWCNSAEFDAINIPGTPYSRTKPMKNPRSFLNATGCFGDRFVPNSLPERKFYKIGSRRDYFGHLDYTDFANGALAITCRGRCFKPEGNDLGSACSCTDGEQVPTFFDRKSRYLALRVLTTIFGFFHHVETFACSWVHRDAIRSSRKSKTAKSFKWAIMKSPFLRKKLYPQTDTQLECCGEYDKEGIKRALPLPTKCQLCCGVPRQPCEGISPDDYSNHADKCFDWLDTEFKSEAQFKIKGQNPCQTKELGNSWGRRRRRRRGKKGIFAAVKKFAPTKVAKFAKAAIKKAKKTGRSFVKGKLLAAAKYMLGKLNGLSEKYGFPETWNLFRDLLAAKLAGKKKQAKKERQILMGKISSGSLSKTIGSEVGPVIVYTILVNTQSDLKRARKAIPKGQHPYWAKVVGRNKIPPKNQRVPKKYLVQFMARLAATEMEALYGQIAGYCDAISGGITMKAPTFAVSAQSFHVWGPLGFMKPGEQFNAFTVYLVKAHPDWWIKAARSHSDVQNHCVFEGEHSQRNGTCIELTQPMATKVATWAPWICFSQYSNECPMVPKYDKGRYFYPNGLGGDLSKLAARNGFSCDVTKPTNADEKDGNCGPNCVGEFKFKVNACNTCCCRDGLVSASVDSNMIGNDERSDCGVWLGSMDNFLRMTMSVIRNLLMTIRFRTPCFQPFEKAASSNRLGSGATVEQGRRGGRFGTSGTFNFVTGGNRAGNSERVL